MTKAAEITIYETIGEGFWGDGMSAKRFAGILRSVGQVDEITLRLNSPGGAAFDGIAIYNLLKEHPAKITASIDGLAASAASLIAMAGDTVRIADNAFMMIHNALGLAMGNAVDMTKMADMLGKLDGQIAATYAAKSGRDAAEHTAQMSAETWFTATEAVAAGLANEVGQATDATPANIAAFCEKKLYTKAPADLLARLKRADDALSAGAKGRLYHARALEVAAIAGG